MVDNSDDLTDRINEKYFGKSISKKKEKKKKSKLYNAFSGIARKSLDTTVDFLTGHKKAVGITSLGVITVAIIFYFLGMDYLTKRQPYPIRNVLYHVQNTVSYSGGEKEQNARTTDRQNTSMIYSGSTDITDATRLGDLLGKFVSVESDEQMQYDLENQDKTRIAYAIKKHEAIQSGLRIRGTINYKEQNAGIVGESKHFVTYSFIPERGTKHIRLNVLVDENDNRTLVNELVMSRTLGIGTFFGEKFRSNTKLNEFTETNENKQLIEELFKTIDAYNIPRELSKKEREDLVNKMIGIEKKLQKLPIYASFEDGLFDILPQESSTYLFSNPSLKQRISHLFSSSDQTISNTSEYPTRDYIANPKPISIKNPEKDIIKIRVENHWDLWPGSYWLLNRLNIGSHPNIMKPFAHYNNGGYTIKDNIGDIAKVNFKDFILHYGDDVLYQYFLDKNADGKINKNTELIGQVLYRRSQDEREDLETEIGQGKEKKDITRRFIYTFMAGNDWEKRHEEFYLCNTIESFIANELNRGFGKHSFLGWINNQRSSILLLENPSTENLSRALTPESTIVAKYDVVALFRAAGRDYVNKYIHNIDK